MKFTLDELNLEITLKDLTIDSNKNRIDDIIGEITSAVGQVIYNRLGSASEIEVIDANNLEVAKEDLDKVVHITNISYDLEDEEVSERRLPNSLNVSLEDLDINYCCIIEDKKYLKDVIRIALNYYLIDNNYARTNEQIVEDFNYEIEK